MFRLCCQERTRRPSQTVSTYQPARYRKATLNSKLVSEVLGAAKNPINSVVETVGKLSQAASKMPYYKFNNMWSRQMQGAVCRLFHVHTTLCDTDDIEGRGTTILGLAWRLQA
jgi:hypothetical protein